MQQRKFAYETSSYGTADPPAEKQRAAKTMPSPFRTDVCIFALLWLMCATCMVPHAFMADKLVSHIAVFYCFALSCILTCLSWQRGMAWQLYSIICFLSTAFGNYMGRYAWAHHPPHHDGALNGRAVALCVITLYALLVCAVILGAFLPAWGYGIIGTSTKFARDRGWGWEPLALQHMDFGCNWCGDNAPQDHVYPDRVLHDLMYHRAYWSGEPALDYTFHIANDHLFLGCAFSHPASVFTKFDRIFVMVIILVLVVFPVAAFTVWLNDLPLLRTLLQAVIVTLPRNMMKHELRKVSVQSSLLKEERDAALGSKFKRLVMKHFTKKSMMDNHERETLQHQEEAADSTAYFKWLVVAITVIICYISYLVIHLRDEDFDHDWSTMQIDGREVTTLGILADNLDGLVFAFTLEPLIMMVHTTRAQDGPRKEGWFVGFFSQWWHERKEFGSLRPRGREFSAPRPVLEAIQHAGTAVGQVVTDGPPTFQRGASFIRRESSRNSSSYTPEAVNAAEGALLNSRGSRTSSSQVEV